MRLLSSLPARFTSVVKINNSVKANGTKLAVIEPTEGRLQVSCQLMLINNEPVCNLVRNAFSSVFTTVWNILLADIRLCLIGCPDIFPIHLPHTIWLLLGLGLDMLHMRHRHNNELCRGRMTGRLVLAGKCAGAIIRRGQILGVPRPYGGISWIRVTVDKCFFSINLA